VKHIHNTTVFGCRCGRIAVKHIHNTTVFGCRCGRIAVKHIHNNAVFGCRCGRIAVKHLHNTTVFGCRCGRIAVWVRSWVCQRLTSSFQPTLILFLGKQRYRQWNSKSLCFVDIFAFVVISFIYLQHLQHSMQYCF